MLRNQSVHRDDDRVELAPVGCRAPSHLGPVAAPWISVGSRRWFLQAGMRGMTGLGLGAAGLAATGVGGDLSGIGRLLGAESSDARGKNAVIQIWLSGGPSQIDMWDPKPEMPAEIRGPFQPISTAVPGIAICEHMPKQAAMMEKFAIIRSMDASSSDHTPITFQAGNPKAQRVNIGRDGGGYPSMGSVAARYRGANRSGVPPFVALADSMVSDIYGAGDLGQSFEPLDGVRAAGRFAMPQGIAVPRLHDRDRLRREFDRFTRDAERSTGVAGYRQQDRFAAEAFDLVLSGEAHRAFDLSREPDSVRDRYGRDSMGEKALLARRLIEAGVTFLTLSDAWGHWDHHGDEVRWGGIEKGLTPMLPVLDRGLTTLIQDLEERGLLDTTLVIVVGEFGRSPVMTKTAGRDHWPQVMSMLVAGGGIRGGQVIGATDRRGGAIRERPLGPSDLAATVFRHLGIDRREHWTNPAGRPVPIVESGEVIRELYG
ncbi:MAG: hypothetical protein RIS70_1736 [Planctomycetota bacterium]